MDPIAEQFAWAASNDNMELEKRLKHECAPSTPATSSHGAHVASGHAAKQLPLPGLENGVEEGH